MFEKVPYLCGAFLFLCLNTVTMETIFIFIKTLFYIFLICIIGSLYPTIKTYLDGEVKIQKEEYKNMQYHNYNLKRNFKEFTYDFTPEELS